jgi:hypothetical protein
MLITECRGRRAQLLGLVEAGLVHLRGDGIGGHDLRGKRGEDDHAGWVGWKPRLLVVQGQDDRHYAISEIV